MTYLFTKCVTESCDSPDWLIQYCLSSASSRVTETVSINMPCEECFQKCFSANRSGLKAPAEPSCRPTEFIFQYYHLWRFFKNKYYLKSSHRLKAISGTLIIVVNSYNLDLIDISLRSIKLSINRPGCGL